jgi:predicted transcriptional regulator
MLLAKERRERCLKMRIAGLSEREIAARLGVCQTQVVRMLKTSFDALNASELNSAAYLRRLDLQRCDEMITGLMPHRRDPRYVDSLLRILERRASYLGIDAPTKAEIVSKNIVEEDFPDLDALPDEDLDTIERLLDKARALKAAKMLGEHDAKT